MRDFCILGAGISGSLIANKLSKKYTVEVCDKARGVGGRSSNKRYFKNLSFDHGLQYINPKERKFKIFINEMLKKKVLKKWNGNHLNYNLENNTNITKYIGLKKNSSICKYLLKDIKTICSNKIINIKYNTNFWIVSFSNGKRVNYKNIILTCPYPQTRILAKNYLKKKILKSKITMQPNITIMIAYKNNKEIPVSSIKFNDKVLAWASNENSKKRFKSKINLWTIQATLYWSKKYIRLYKLNKNKLLKKIIKKFESLTGLPSKKIIFKSMHGWKYAYNLHNSNENCYWDKKYRIGICGDWFLGSKAEDAFFSAEHLFKVIKKNPPK